MIGGNINWLQQKDLKPKGHKNSFDEDEEERK